MNHSFRKDRDYWDRKLARYLHDPPDKALRIQGHETRSDRLREALGDLPSCDPELYKAADQIASGMDRTPLPGFSKDGSQNGAIDFTEAPVLTHPTGSDQHLTVDLPPAAKDIKAVQSKMAEIIHKDLDGDASGHPGLCHAFEGDPDGLAAARFHYFHHAFRDRLTAENVGGLGGLWRRMPADTRIPDHSIWQHCALVSALCSCFEGSDARQASLVVFSITPVQDFIARSRKLRDFWTGSLILSWLAFEGIREIIYDMGSDHLIYPSLVDQPMVNRLLWTECGLSGVDWKAPIGTDVASFPNKFVFLAPGGLEADLAGRISGRIIRAWTELGGTILAEIEKRIGKPDAYISGLFDTQMRHFFDFHWAASPLMDETRKGRFTRLLPESVWKRAVEFVADTATLQFSAKGYGSFYSVSHALAQSMLAAGKSHRDNLRPPEKGIKCPIHGDLEILHFAEEEDKNPRPEDDPFWKTFKTAWGEDRPDFKKSERLSSVALVKRIAGIVLEDDESHALAPFFENSFTFPSTTEIALTDWLDRVEMDLPDLFEQAGGTRNDRRKALAQHVHAAEDPEYGDKTDEKEVARLTGDQRKLCRRIVRTMEGRGTPISETDKYFAVLMMDGDHMGKLVNGETLGATWSSVIHPELMDRMTRPGFDERYRAFWSKHQGSTRLVSPAVHAAISEALGAFSLNTVPAIVDKYKGKLIYAGGDDVCAVLPVSTALPAAREIARAYTMGFVSQRSNGEKKQTVRGEWAPSEGSIGCYLGSGAGISISAGVLIWHHKRPLSMAIRKANALLKEKAKKAGDRNALAVELAKRAGGSRFFVCGWHEKPLDSLGLQMETGDSVILDHFIGVARQISDGKRLSSSFLYRMESFRLGLEAIAKADPGGMVKFLPSQIKGEKAEEADLAKLSKGIAALLVRGRKDDIAVDTEPLIIARFLAPLMARRDEQRRS